MGQNQSAKRKEEEVKEDEEEEVKEEEEEEEEEIDEDDELYLDFVIHMLIKYKRLLKKRAKNTEYLIDERLY